jgi:hypothetical protein
VINCAGTQVPNHWESIGVKYLTYFWADQEGQVILDTKGQIANECYEFIIKAFDSGDSVLIHSVKGQNRAFTITAMWIMRRYQWRLPKTLEFLKSRRPNLEIRSNFILQLTAYENRLLAQGLGPKTSTWDEVTEHSIYFENEELLLCNTYLNARMGPIAALPSASERRKPPRLRWADDLKERAALAVVMKENEVIPNVTENFRAVSNIEEVPVKEESKHAELLRAQYLDPKGPIPKADELIKKYIGTSNAKNNDNPRLPPYGSMKDPFYDNGKYDLFNVERYSNDKQSNVIRPQSNNTDTKKAQSINNKQGTDLRAINTEQTINARESMNDAKYKRITQYTKAQIEDQSGNSKVVKEIIDPRKFKCIEAKGSQYSDSNVIRNTEQLKSSDKFNKYLRATDNGNQHIVKGADPSEKIMKSINQMMDLNEAMNKRLYQETQGQKINYPQRPPSAQEQIKKVTPAKRTNSRPSSATIKRDAAIPKTTQRYSLV